LKQLNFIVGQRTTSQREYFSNQRYQGSTPLSLTIQIRLEVPQSEVEKIKRIGLKRLNMKVQVKKKKNNYTDST